MKIKEGDQVIILGGKDRKKKGKVIAAFPNEGKILVEGVNIKKRHQRPKKQGDKGQIIEKPSPIFVSNAQLVCPKCGQPARMGSKTIGKKKYRVCKKCEQEI